jgi:hypothetical protein
LMVNRAMSLGSNDRSLGSSLKVVMLRPLRFGKGGWGRRGGGVWLDVDSEGQVGRWLGGGLRRLQTGEEDGVGREPISWRSSVRPEG